MDAASDLFIMLTIGSVEYAIEAIKVGFASSLKSSNQAELHIAWLYNRWCADTTRRCPRRREARPIALVGVLVHRKDYGNRWAPWMRHVRAHRGRAHND